MLECVHWIYGRLSGMTPITVTLKWSMAAKLRYLLLIDLSTSVYGTEANSTINK